MRLHLSRVFILLVLAYAAIPFSYATENPTVTARLEKKYKRVKFIEDNGLEYYETIDDSNWNWKYGIVDNNGNEVIPCQYDFIAPKGLMDENYDMYFYERYFWLLQTQDKKHGLADSKGKIIVPCIYEDYPFAIGYQGSKGFDYSKGIFIMVTDDYGVVLMSETGKVIIPSSRRYSDISLWTNEADGTCIMAVKKDGKVGLLDANGKELVPPSYKSGFIISGFYDMPTRYINFSSDQGDGLYDYKKKKIAVSPKYYHAQGWYNIVETREKQNGQLKLYYEGKLLTTAKSTFCLKKEDGNGNYYLKYETSDHHAGLINLETGNMLPQFDSIMEIKEGNVFVEEKGVMHIYSLEALEKGSMESLAHISKDEATKGGVSDVDVNIPRTKKEAESTFAVIIANESYETFVVPYAANDGAVFKKYCQDALGIPGTNIIYYEDATINNIYAAVNRIKNLAEVYDDGCNVIFYYSGQGISDENTKAMYLLPSDGTLKAISSTCYSVEKLYREIGTLPNVNEALFILDASFNGMKRVNQPMENSRGVAIKSKANAVVGKTIAIEAAGAGETAFGNPQQNHGLLTYFLLKAIQQTNGKTPIVDLIPDVAKKVKETALRDMNAPQTVQLKKAY